MGCAPHDQKDDAIFNIPVSLDSPTSRPITLDDQVESWNYPDIKHSDGTTTRMIWVTAGEVDAYLALVNTLPRVVSKAVVVEKVPGFMKQSRRGVETGAIAESPTAVLDALMIRGQIPDVDDVTRVVLGIQQSVPQIDVGIRVVEVLESDGFSFGIDTKWQSVEDDPSKPTKTLFDSAASALGLPEIPGRGGRFSSGTSNPPLLVDLGTISDGVQVDFLVRALQLFNKTQVLSAPHIAVIDGHAAQIVAGDEIPYLTINPSPFGSPTVSTAFKNVGIKLFVTPKVIGRRLIRINLTTAVQSVTGESSFESNNIRISNPIIATRQASTVMDVHDGETAIIGGLLTHQRSDAENKVPVLGDIPLLNFFFSSRSQQSLQSNLIFFITPKIIDPARDRRPIVIPTLPPGPETEVK